MSTTTSPVTSISDELLAELELLAGKASAMALDSADEVTKAEPSAMIECPVCGGEGYASLENDYCNFDNHAIGVQFYGIGPEFGLAEDYFRAANPATILALIQHVRELKCDAEKFQQIVCAVVREIPHRNMSRGNAPGHGHSIAGVWDEDNGALAGSECAWCKTWYAAVDAARSATNEDKQ